MHGTSRNEAPTLIICHISDKYVSPFQQHQRIRFVEKLDLAFSQNWKHWGVQRVKRSQMSLVSEEQDLSGSPGG